MILLVPIFFQKYDIYQFSKVCCLLQKPGQQLGIKELKSCDKCINKKRVADFFHKKATDIYALIRENT